MTEIIYGPLWTKSAKANDPDVAHYSSQNMLVSLKMKTLFLLVIKYKCDEYKYLKNIEMYKGENESI